MLALAAALVKDQGALVEQAMPDLALAAARRGHDMLAGRPDLSDDERDTALRDIAGWLDPLWERLDQLDDAVAALSLKLSAWQRPKLGPARTPQPSQSAVIGSKPMERPWRIFRS